MNSLNNIPNRVIKKNIFSLKKGVLPAIQLMNNRLEQQGGSMQDDRMIKDKRRSLDKAVLYSYQGAFVKKYNCDSTEENEYAFPVRALINPNKLKQDYDDKIISIGFEHGFQSGDIFEWINTGTYWLIYLQDLTELAYFRGDIRRCSYQLIWEDENGTHQTYCAVRGPVETKINYIQKHGISVDEPNHSLNILMPKNENTLKYFKRYAKFYLQDNIDEHKVCWRVEAVDWISMPGILEINCVEYYANETEDDIDNGIVGAKLQSLNIDISNIIIGETFIKPKIEYIYQINNENIEGDWIIDSKLPIQLTKIDNKQVKIKWIASYSGQFDLSYGDYTKTVVVESLF